MKFYIHVPFCHSKCAYCDFYSTPRRELMTAYTDALSGEWLERGEGKGWMADTIYVGGGTPSSLPVELLARAIALLPTGPGLRECTVEANPDDVTREWVSGILRYTPARRVSMGIQSFNDRELSFIGRRHTSARAREAFDTLRSEGVDNISCDLIYGLPGQDIDSWRRSLDTLAGMRPEHISAYLLSYEPRTRLGVMLDQGKVAEADEETASRMYTLLCDTLRDAGYRHYEISNFALPGREAIHNSGYWDGSDYLGLGPAAHSLIYGVRGYNPPSLKDYIACGGRGFHVIEEEDALNRLNDLIITSLRTSRGLSPDKVTPELYPPYAVDDFFAEARRLTETGELTVGADGSLSIPERRWLHSDAILRRLIQI